ncbi:nuclear transport factor 2 family protein [Mycolicibacterium stellerae]|uniref:nuclear transport factor 2 family protein n=1 Tax=Mycolicibacterium stellerae TaxID=2358193 RepID=UPI0013DE73C2|nr:nuclear transport factor 2 family protein [Mycolicibacterium stellerae]
MARTALETVSLYFRDMWNGRSVELVTEICANPITRHDPGNNRTLSHAEQIARIVELMNKDEPHIELSVLHGDDTHVTAVWNIVRAGGGQRVISGIEVFRVRDGRITDVWNSPYSTEPWV